MLRRDEVSSYRYDYPIGNCCKYCGSNQLFDPLSVPDADSLWTAVVCDVCEKKIKELVTMPDPTRKILWQLIHALGQNCFISTDNATDWLNELQEEDKDDTGA